MRATSVASAIALSAGLALAAPPDRSFFHKDWQLACDNTRTCRAAGYERDEDDNAVSILLVRKAGPGTAVEGQLQLGSTDGDDTQVAHEAQLSIGGKSGGKLHFPKGSTTANLAPAQVGALLRALTGSGQILVTEGDRRWVVSGDGAAAVLLKMDDLQGRVGTAGALARKGAAAETAVLPPLPPPVIQAVRVAAERKEDAALAERIGKTLPASDECPLAAEREAPPSLWRLDAHRVLVATPCWRAAYNEGNGYWISGDKPPYDPKLVTDSGADFDPATGTISLDQKGRGPGDCFGHETWVWNGRDFVHASETTTGLCRHVAAGGAWDLPTLVSDVRPPR